MAQDSESSGEKTEEASQYRVDEFREKGIVPLSKELVSIIVLCISIFLLLGTSVFLFEVLLDYFEWITTQNYAEILSIKKLSKLINKSVYVILYSCAPLFLGTMLIGVVSHILQVGIIFSVEQLELKWERVNPINGISRLFSSKSVFDLLKAILKFIIVLGIGYTYFRDELKAINIYSQISFLESFVYLKNNMLGVIVRILIGLGVMAIIDMFWERYQFSQKLLQTKQEVKEESREKEGNPEIKQRIRTVQRQIAQRKMMGEIKKSDVIITNPTHYSIAVKYDASTMRAPVVVAKGVDELALSIRKLALKHNIPMVENISLARTLYKTTAIGDSIPRDLYKVVAQILAYVYKKKKKGVV